ncbi:GL10258 [Drosophila persimilis]|uniref:GL10258 n=1 Tax=Drosophila persimilis TaxID=7234 RepID=B4HCR0_DROPE|nr:GL10258 [Drosophila persimilis]
MEVGTEADASDTSLASVGASSSSSVPARRLGRPKSTADKKGAKKIGLGIGLTGEQPIPAERSPPPSLPFEEAVATSGTSAATTNRYDELVMALAGERARMPPPPRPAAAAHTGTTVVTTAAKELVERVKKTVVPTLGVRVHEVRELKSGRAIIRTPSVSELRKVVASSKFTEAGLEVKKRPETKPQVVVYDVDTSITPEEFMEELFTKNLEETMTAAEFKKSVHLGSKPWSVTDGATINVTLEVDAKAQEALRECVYIKWFRCRCRSLVRTYACHRCAGFDHKVSQCRLKENVKSRRYPGMDGITGAICKVLWHAIPQHMTAMYSRCLETGHFPTEWKHHRVVPLLLGPDKDRTDPTSYRGICLLPVLGKVLKGIMVKDTTGWLQMAIWLSPRTLCGGCLETRHLRELDGLGVQHTDGDWTFSEMMASQERMRILDRFAGLVLSRRQQLLNVRTGWVDSLSRPIEAKREDRAESLRSVPRVVQFQGCTLRSAP